MWSEGSVVFHKVEGDYDHVELLRKCAHAPAAAPPNASALAPFVRAEARVAQAQYLALVGAAARRGVEIISREAPSGPLWDCEWVGGFGVTVRTQGL